MGQNILNSNLEAQRFRGKLSYCLVNKGLGKNLISLSVWSGILNIPWVHLIFRASIQWEVRREISRILGAVRSDVKLSSPEAPFTTNPSMDK